MQDIARRTHNTLIAAAAAAAPSAAARRCDDERGLALVCLAQRSNKNIQRLSITSLLMPVACQYVTRAGCRPGMPSPTVFFSDGGTRFPATPLKCDHLHALCNNNNDCEFGDIAVHRFPQ